MIASMRLLKNCDAPESYSGDIRLLAIWDDHGKAGKAGERQIVFSFGNSDNIFFFDVNFRKMVNLMSDFSCFLKYRFNKNKEFKCSFDLMPCVFDTRHLRISLAVRHITNGAISINASINDLKDLAFIVSTSDARQFIWAIQKSLVDPLECLLTRSVPVV